MERKLKMGAIKKGTGEYKLVSEGIKKEEYECPECNKEVILRKGEKNRVHYAHKKENKCEYYEKPSESQIHKEGKKLIKRLIEKNWLEIYKECVECREKEYMKIPEYTYDKKVELECSFKYDISNEEINENGTLRIADVAYLNENQEIIWIIEILNTHKTKEEDRPEPWNEIEAKELLKIVDKDKIKIKCSREYTCEKCNEKKYIELNQLNLRNILKSVDLEWFIRYKLGQRIFKKQTEHLRIDYDSMHNNDEVNEKILDLFKKYYGKKKIILKTTKGLVYVRFVEKNENDENINNNVYEEEENANPNEIFINLTGYGTIEIIKYILENIQKKYITINNDLKREDYKKMVNDRVYLSVDYDDRKKKKMGGLWDIEIKNWYVKKTNENLVKILEKYETVKICISNDIKKHIENNKKKDKINNKNVKENIKKEDKIESPMNKENILKIITKKMEEVKNINQQNKYKKLKEICNNDLNVDYRNTINIENEYYISIIHSKTNKRIDCHLKTDNIYMNNMKDKTNQILNCIKRNIKEIPEEIHNIIEHHETYGKIYKNIYEKETLDNINEYELGFDNHDNNYQKNIKNFILLLNYYKIGKNDKEFEEYMDSCVEYKWKIKNIIEWSKSDGSFKRCTNCDCIYSYKNDKIICENKYCKTPIEI